MSIEDKQTFLKQSIIERGINPEDFFEYWQNLQLELDDVEIDRLKEIVEDFFEQLPKQQEPAQKENQQKEEANEDEQDQFDDFQTAQESEHKEVKQVKNEYADFNWDFLNIKKNQHEPLPETSNPSSSIDSPLKVIDTDSPKQKTKKSQKMSFTPTPVKKQQPKPKAKDPPTKKHVNEVKPKQQNANLIEQINERPQNFNRELPDTGNPAEQKSITVKEVLQASKLGKLKCLKLQENVLSHHTNVEIFITNIQEVEEKNQSLIKQLIKNSTHFFTIKTVARNKNRSIGISWEVKRKPHDFEWLRNTLVKFYPGLVVPPLPSEPKSKEKLSGYQKKLQHFLLDCYRCPELKNSKYYEAFLSYGNRADFDSFIKNSTTASKPRTLDHIINMKGTIDTLYSSNIEQYGIGLQNYLTKTSNHLKNVNHILNGINDAYDTISQLYRDLGNQFLEMSDQSHEFSDQKCYGRLAATYKQIAILTTEHSSFCQSQKDFVEAFMKSHFSYEKLRLENMQNLITKRSTFAFQLSKRSNKQDEGKGMFGKLTSLFGQKTQYVDAPSSNYETLNNQVGYYNNQLLQESIRCVEGMIESHINHFSGYGHSRIDNVDQLQKIWSNQLVELSKLQLSK